MAGEGEGSDCIAARPGPALRPGTRNVGETSGAGGRSGRRRVGFGNAGAAPEAENDKTPRMGSGTDGGGGAGEPEIRSWNGVGDERISKCTHSRKSPGTWARSRASSAGVR